MKLVPSSEAQTFRPSDLRGFQGAELRRPFQLAPLIKSQVKPPDMAEPVDSGIYTRESRAKQQRRDRQNAGSCELYYRWNSVTCMGKQYLLPKTIPPIAMVLKLY